MGKSTHVSETPATSWLKRHGVDYSEHVYTYVEHGGTEESSRPRALHQGGRGEYVGHAEGRACLRTTWYSASI